MYKHRILLYCNLITLFIICYNILMFHKILLIRTKINAWYYGFLMNLYFKEVIFTELIIVQKIMQYQFLIKQCNSFESFCLYFTYLLVISFNPYLSLTAHLTL